MNLFRIIDIFTTINAASDLACGILMVFVLIKAHVALDTYIKNNRR
ncbi:MAG: hypothetical protein ACLSH8_14020 [Zhenhengia sp.]|jgi:hypothetical protein|nr:hypothetical protein [Clostridiales bacterium]